MASNFCLKLKHDHVLTILLLVLVWLNYIATVISEGNQVEAAFVMNKKCIDKERHALLDIKAMILQEPFGKLSTWGIDDCCKWTGVICNNQSGHVIKLDLSGCGLEGEISPSLLNLTYLTRLDLPGNYFKGTILMSIGFLTELRHLDLSLNSFNGTIPMSIGFLTKLRYLDLSWNYFKGTIPMSIGFLTELRHLDLSVNSFNGTIPMSIGFLTELRYLDLSVNSFTGTIPMSIGSLTELRNLDLSFNSFNGTIPMSIGFLTELIYLDLHHNSFNGTIPMSIGSLTELTGLFLSYNSFSGTIPGSIGSMTKLRYLHLSSNLLYGTIPREFGNLTNLRELHLVNVGSCRVENLDWLSRSSHLEELSMAGVSLAKANHWVNIITSLQNLTYLNLDQCNLSQVMYPYSISYVNSNFTSSSIVQLYLGDNNLNSSISHWLFPLTSNKLDTLDLSGNMLDGIPKYLGNLCLKSLYLNENSALANFSDFLKSLSGCTTATLGKLNASSSQFTGSFSDDIQNFSSLYALSIDHNQFNGTISEKVWELPYLRYLDASFNSLRDVISENIVQSKSNVSYVDLLSCKIGPRFPRWIHTLRNLTYLNVARNGISDTIPVEFWDMWPSSLQYLNLSSNNITGTVPDLLSNFDMYSVIDLSSNCFYGTISNVVSTVASLDLSKNKFYGGISFLCQIVDGILMHLDLSNNSFSGQLPNCLWHFQNLKVLNLENNNFSGRLPNSVENLRALEVLYLYNNFFSGELPLSLGNCTKLTFLDLGDNKFSGYVPSWIGEITGLYALSLSSNNFYGPIPVQLCQLVNLQILDLSMNNLSGTIPSCVNNLTAMVREGSLITQDVHFLGDFAVGFFQAGRDIYYDDHAMIQWQGKKREFSSILRLLKSIDLSSNNLTGKIPNELTDLRGLVALNLSLNALLGEIPQNIGLMKELQIFDLSRNNLSGGLPSYMSQMTSLDYLDVSYNSLSGRIPSSTQLQSFLPSRYTGNAGLCGLPLIIACLGEKESIGESHGDGEDRDELQRWFYIGGTTGFTVGFWIVCSTLLVNRRGRHTFFQFLDSLESWVYVKVMVFIAKFQRAGHT